MAGMGATRASDDVRRRARKLLDDLVEPGVFGAGRAVDIAAHHVGGEPIPYEEAVTRPFSPFPVGGAWGPTWDTTWFRVNGTIPPEWAGEAVVLRVEHTRRGDTRPGGESLAFVGGIPVQGLSPYHRDLLVTASAAGGEPVEVYLEAAANPTNPEDRMSGFDWPLLRPEPGGEPRFVLARCELAVRRPAVDALAADLRSAIGLAERVPGDTDLHAALEAACAAVDPADVAGTAGAARAALGPVLARRAGDGAHRVTAVGHAHIDTAWLWPLRESVRKCARTYATAVTLMEAYPEYHFACSAAQHLAWIEERYPALFARIAQRVAAGQFGLVGGMWVEADCNLASGESLVRQIVHGTRWFESRFGVRGRELWLPDAFGYTAALPQIMAQAGIGWFVSQKLSWNDTNRFPHSTFWWEGIDGTRVRAHFPPADTYNGDMSMRELFRGAAAGTRSLYPYGHGDGGGGPTREMIEAARRAADLAGAPQVALEPAAAFFAAAEADPAPLPVWVGDLYLEKHRGTFTSQAAIKRGNRRAEAALAAAELWCTLAAGAGGDLEWPGGELDRAWKLLLTNQFHDILPGSSIRWVAEEAEADLAESCRVADDLSEAATAAVAARVDTAGMAEPVVVFNPTGFPRREVAVHGGRVFVADVPALGYAAVDASAAAAAPREGAVETGDGWMDNGHVRLRWDGDGRLVSVYDRDHDREVLAPGRVGNDFQLHDDRPADWDAWDVDRAYFDSMVSLDGPVDVEVEERGGLRGAVRFRRRFGASEIGQTVVLTAGSRRVDFVTDVDWQEDHKFLKVAFPVAVHAARATFEIQFGHLERPTHENTSWEQARFEVCAQRWADLSEAGYGVALLNDCKYGYDVRGNVLRLSLLRAPTAPDPRCDRGRHRFTYALLPHGGDLRAGGVIPAGYALNAPLAVVPAGPPRPGPLPPAWSAATVDGDGFVVETVKRADDGAGVVLRGYEAFGGHRRVTVRPGVPFRRAVRANLFEEATGEVPVGAAGEVHLALRPFELVTLRLLP